MIARIRDNPLVLYLHFILYRYWQVIYIYEENSKIQMQIGLVKFIQRYKRANNWSVHYVITIILPFLSQTHHIGFETAAAILLLFQARHYSYLLSFRVLFVLPPSSDSWLESVSSRNLLSFFLLLTLADTVVVDSSAAAEGE